MVDTQPGIALERAPPIFPEAIDGLTRVQTADRVGPSLFQQPMIGRFHLGRSEEHTSELQSLMRISYAVFCLKKKKKTTNTPSRDRKENKVTSKEVTKH